MPTTAGTLWYVWVPKGFHGYPWKPFGTHSTQPRARQHVRRRKIEQQTEPNTKGTQTWANQSLSVHFQPTSCPETNNPSPNHRASTKQPPTSGPETCFQRLCRALASSASSCHRCCAAATHDNMDTLHTQGVWSRPSDGRVIRPCCRRAKGLRDCEMWFRKHQPPTTNRPPPTGGTSAV